MLQEEKTIIAIQRLLDRNEKIDTPVNRTLAKQFNDIVIKLNARLDRCAELLQNNRAIEAINFAEAQPPVLEIASKANFPRFSEWKEICQENGFPVPPEISENIIDQLNDAYSDTMSLQPLVDAYRKISRKGSVEERVRLLRKIKVLDPANSSWTENLIKLEKQYMRDLLKKAEKALSANCESDIQNIYMDLTSSDWTVIPPKDMLKNLQNALHNFHSLRLKQRVQEITAEVSDAYSMLEYAPLKSAISKWDTFLKQNEYSPDKTDLRQIDEAREWLDMQTAEKKRDKKYKETLNAFEEKLTTQCSELELDNLFHKLEHFDEEIPKRILNRYYEMKDNFIIVRKRKFTFILTAVIAIIIVAVAAGVYMLHVQNQKKMYSSFLTTLDAAIEKKSALLADKLDKSFKKKHPEIYKEHPELKIREEKIASMISSEKSRVEMVQNLISNADKIISEDFKNGTSAIDVIIDQLKEKVEKDDEKLALQRISIARDDYLSGVETRDSTTYNKITQELFDLSGTLCEINPALDVEGYKKSIEKFELMLHKLKTVKIKDIKQAEKTEKEFDDSLKVFKKKQLDGKNRNMACKQYLNTVYDTALNLDTYEKNLKYFIEKYKEFPVTKQVSKLKNMIPAYKEAVLLKEFSPKGATEENITALNTRLEEEGFVNIWGNKLPEYLKWLKQFRHNVALIRKGVEVIRNHPNMKQKVWAFKDKNDGILEFFIDTYKTAKTTFDTNNFAISEYWVLCADGTRKQLRFKEMKDNLWNIYTLSPARKTKEGKRVRDVTLIYTGVKLLIQDENPSYVTYYMDFVKRFDKVDDFDLENFLTEEIANLKEQKEMNKYMQLVLIQTFIDYLEKISYKQGDTFKQEQDKISKIFDIEINIRSFNMWNKTRKKVEETVEQIQQGIKDLSSQVHQDLLQRKILTYAFGRKISQVGYIKDNRAVLKKSDGYKELWILEKDSDGQLRFFIVGNKLSEIDKLQSAVPVSDGMVLFAPFDNRRTPELINEISKYAEKYNLKWDKTLPQVWPIQAVKE